MHLVEFSRRPPPTLPRDDHRLVSRHAHVPRPEETNELPQVPTAPRFHSEEMPRIRRWKLFIARRRPSLGDIQIPSRHAG